MEEIESFLLNGYKQAELYILDMKSDFLDILYNFDYIKLTKVGLVIVFGYFLGKFLGKYIPGGIQALGKKINLSIDNDFTIALRSFIFKMVTFGFVLLGIKLWLPPKSIDFIASSIVKSMLILSTVGFLLNIVKLTLHKMANSPRTQDSVQVVQASTLPLFENTALILFSMVGIYQIFAIWHVDMTALLAGAGIGAMAVGMAAKDTLSDIIAGILILTDAPYRVGDVVYVRNNLKGRVIAIGLRNTRLVTKSNIEVIVPNTIMGTSQIINESSSKKDGIRIEVFMSVSNGEDVHRVKRLLIEATNTSKKIAQDKPIKAIMTSFQMDMLDFKIQCWIDDPEEKGSAKGELMENVYLKFKEENIDISMTRYQHVRLSYEEAQEVYIKELPESKQDIYVKEFPKTTQEQYVKEFPQTKQEHFVKEFPQTKQEHYVKEFPETKQEHFVKEFPKTKQEHYVKEFPETKQEHYVKEFPRTKEEHYIKEIPNIFGVGQPKKIDKNPQKTTKIKKEKDEK